MKKLLSLLTFVALLTGLRAQTTDCSDTASKSISTVDCGPQTTLPWTETFANGIDCWYRPTGSNWTDNIPFNDTSYEAYRALTSLCSSNMSDQWIVSKAIILPADSNAVMMLEWEAGTTSSYAMLQPNYSVLVTTDSDYTDLSNYTTLMTDNNGLPQCGMNWATRDHRSVSLLGYAGDTIHIAFCNHPTNFSGMEIMLVVDNITLRATTLPVLTLTAPAEVSSLESVTFEGILNEGSHAGLSFLWHSTLLDSSWTSPAANTAVSTLAYSTAGTDTVTLIATNTYGSDTATAIVFVNDCSPITTLPYLEEFSNVTPVSYSFAGGEMPPCWNAYWNGDDGQSPYVINHFLSGPIQSYVQNNAALLLMAGTSNSGWDSVVTVETPAFGLPLNQQMLSFFYLFENVNYGTLQVGYMQGDNFVSIAEMTPQTTGRTDTLSLAAFPANADRIALHWERTGVWFSVIIDNLRVFARDSMPVVFLSAPDSTWTGDTVTFSANLYNGSYDSLTYIWHSQLMDTTVTTTTATLDWVYTLPGTDTLTLIAANAYGSDTAWAVLNVGSHPLPLVSLSAPAEVAMDSTVNVTATLNDCSHAAFTASWHSSLMDTTWTSDLSEGTNTETLVYPFGGTDTLTLIVTNAFGSDTASAVIDVISCIMSVPYSEDFSTVTPAAYNAAGHLPVCWHNYWDGTNPAPHVVGSYSYAPISSNALCMIAGASTGYAQTAVVELPPMAESLRLLSLVIEYKMENISYGTLNVGYMNADEFVAMEQLPSVSGTMRLDTVSFAAASIPNGRIALQWNCDYIWYAVLINQVTVYQSSFIDTPANLTVDSVSHFCASLSWSPVEDATAYLVSLQGVGDTLVSDTAATLCGLLEDTDYSVRVATIVGTDTSAYSNPVTFHTLPFLFYTIELSVNDTAMGSVSGAGTYQEGSTVTLTATPNEGYHFVMWDDSVTASLRTVEVLSDMSFTAFFAADEVDSGWYTVTLLMQTTDGSSIDSSETLCHVVGAGRYAEGSLVTVTAHGNAPMDFLYWKLDGLNPLWYEPDLYLVVTDDVTLTAVFGTTQGIDDVVDSDFRLYPNPASSSVTLETDRPATATLFDASGRQQGQWKVLGGKSQLDISHLPQGVYFLRLNGSSTIRKLIIR